MEGLEELEKIKKFQFTYPILRIGKEKRETTTVGKIFEKELSAIEKKLKALEIISKAYGDYANHKISEYELIMIVGENTTC